MSTVTHIYDAIDRLAPFWLTMDFDNTGILVGDRNREVSCAPSRAGLHPLRYRAGQTARCTVNRHPSPGHLPPPQACQRGRGGLPAHPLRHRRHQRPHQPRHRAGRGQRRAGPAPSVCVTAGAELLNEQNRRLAWPHRHAAGAALPRGVCRPRQILSQRRQCQICRRAAGHPHRRTLFGSGADCLDAAISAGADALLTSEVKTTRISGCRSSRHQHL